MKRAGVQYEEPGEAAREQWEAVVFPEQMRCQEEVEEVLDKITRCHTRMYKTGMFRPGDQQTEMPEMQDLRRKVPKGSAVRLRSSGRDYEPQKFQEGFFCW